MLRRPRIDLRYISLAAILTAAVLPQVASAALGGPETAVAADAQVLKATLQSTDRTNYRVHTIELPSGTVLREYAVVGGSVFAVAWKGPSLPNLRQALGQYFDDFVTGAKAQTGAHHHLEIRQSDLVVQSSGHMRAFSGRAYLPQGLPSGVSLDELH
jgi:Protein of unknown function (DUF2844)